MSTIEDFYASQPDDEKGYWCGHSDAATSPHTFFYTRHGASEDIHPPAFEAVCAHLEELTKVVDGNGDRVVQLIFIRKKHHHPVIAYRFTSDWAYHRYRNELVRIGGSLGRGGFQPFSGSDSYDMKTFVL